MPRIDIDAIEWKGGTGYPEPFRALVEGRVRKRLGDAGGLTQFGVNLTRLGPGSASAHRHWHENEDEFVFILDGEVTLIEDDGETILRAGDAATFKAGVANGHHLVNRSGRDVTYLEIGTRARWIAEPFLMSTWPSRRTPAARDGRARATARQRSGRRSYDRAEPFSQPTGELMQGVFPRVRMLSVTPVERS